MDFSQLKALTEILRTEADEEASGESAFTPASVGQPGGAAKPTQGGDKNFETVLTNPAAAKDPQAIWDDEDVRDDLQDNDDGDTREQPEFDILYKQSITSQDVFLNMGFKDSSTQCCEAMTVVITLPDTRFKDVSLDVTARRLLCRTPKYKLLLDLPHMVDSDKGSAKFDSGKSQLRVTLPITHDED